MEAVMRSATSLALLFGLFALCSATELHACGGYDPLYSALLADDAEARETAVTELRQQGPAALDRLFAMRQRLQGAHAAADDDTQRAVAAWSLRRIGRLIDEVGGQRYCTASRLFWHTDLKAAQAAAQASGKPILSLRMLGNLTDEYSCANSRFFRTTLYANEKIASTLREKFVLHWKSVRPVPVVTIDFGDGRKLKRTVTGNSAHYVLAPDGRPLDVLPGLYHPQAFLEWLTRSEQLAKDYSAAQPWDRDGLLRQHHAERHAAVLAAWQADLAKIGARPAVAKARQRVAAAKADAPKAAQAMPLARTKSAIETPILNVLALQSPEPDANRLEKTTDAEFDQIAALHRYQVDLDDNSAQLIRHELPPNSDAAKLIGKLEQLIGLDTIRNEYRLHTRIHDWFAQNAADADVEVLNEKVYDQLFLTPSSDPWLGLVSDDAYTALQGGGIVTP
jgi:hypothetical protein